ncbi:recombinase family protein [Rhizobium sp. S163]|uniref:recombinase family protein n=1 Tax=Rhizobium sp. S163 TaxID=3055039 RepID=UPI0025A9EEFE|nr:recombinase family protein [Rhizobium sp. S163]MDM9647114.1 recombinase family protein [Rhizobium sp. S163]
MEGIAVGCARTSTFDQVAGLDAQLRDLSHAQCSKIFHEQVSSRATTRPELDKALDYLRDGDTLVVTRIDRLARSMRDLVDLIRHLELKAVQLRVLSLNLETGTPTGKLMVNLLGSIAEFERELMLERQREGIARAQAAGKYKGRAPTAQRRAAEIRQLRADGISADSIANMLGIGRASVFRILRASPNAEG